MGGGVSVCCAICKNADRQQEDRDMVRWSTLSTDHAHGRPSQRLYNWSSLTDFSLEHTRGFFHHRETRRYIADNSPGSAKIEAESLHTVPTLCVSWAKYKMRGGVWHRAANSGAV